MIQVDPGDFDLLISAVTSLCAASARLEQIIAGTPMSHLVLKEARQLREIAERTLDDVKARRGQ